MSTWTNLTFPFGSVLTSTQMSQVQDNFLALATHVAGTPYLTLENSSTALAANANIALPNSWFNGPSVGVNSGGTWYVDANITVSNGTGALSNYFRIVDGAASPVVIASGVVTTITGGYVHVGLSGTTSNPGGNLFKVQGFTPTSWGAATTMIANVSGQSNDTRITAIRIG
jgi:hypothetical protein